MPIFDLILIATLAYNFFKGLYRGFIGVITDIVSLAVSFYLGFTFYPVLGDQFKVFFKTESVYVYLFSFISLWAIAYGMTHIFGKSIKSILTFSILKPVDILGGGIVGLLKGLLILSPFLFGVVFFELPFIDDSVFLPILKPFIETLLETLLH